VISLTTLVSNVIKLVYNALKLVITLINLVCMIEPKIHSVGKYSALITVRE